MHVHLPPTLTYNPHDAWVRNGTLHTEGLCIELLEAFVVFLLCVDLNFKRINLQQLSAFFNIITAILILTGPGEEGVACVWRRLCV